MAQIEFEILDALAEQGWLTVKKHASADLYIWNYTPLTVYKRHWIPETLMARGLITDGTGRIMARPFPKFFNYEEHVGAGLPLPMEPFTVTKKYDGSLGILYFVDHRPYVATRGSFESEQALHATALLHERYLRTVAWNHLEREGITLLWEIVYPDNRIVVDYGTTDDLFLLAAINNDTAEEYNIIDMTSVFPLAQRYDHVTDLDSLRASMTKDASLFSGVQTDSRGVPYLDHPATVSGTEEEGYVVRFRSGLRLKMKYADYVRLHRLLTGVTARTIWDLLRNNQPVEDLIVHVPEEFELWARNTATLLMGEYDAIEATARDVYKKIRKLPSRKEQAITIAGFEHKAVVFKMLDGQPYADIIWKSLKPAAERPFRVQGEAVA